MAVSGDSEEEALEASLLRKLYAPQITIARPADQYAVAREFIPGEKLGSTAYKRRMPVTTLAAAVPPRPRRWVTASASTSAESRAPAPAWSPGSRGTTENRESRVSRCSARAWAAASPPRAATSSTAP